jgi:hypothetical protein
MIKEVNGKKYIFMEQYTHGCRKCVAWKNTDLCASLHDYCVGGYFSEADDQTPEVTVANQEEPTLRDQFAMAALNGLVSANQHVFDQKLAAKAAYALADAMMKERAK